MRQLRAPGTLVCKLPDQHRERLDVAGDSQRTGIDWIKSGVADELGREPL